MTAKRMLVTGGTGTFGTAWIRYALERELAAEIVSFSRNAAMRYALREAIPDYRLTVMAGDVSDLTDLEAVPPCDVIIHAAAEKHIGTGEGQPYWVRKTNVRGAINLITRAAAWGRTLHLPTPGSRLIALSTDKACEPENEYGRTKAEAERAVTGAGHLCCRYGNVIGSSGSVLPLFLRQRAAGRLTLTHRDMTRYFMPLEPSGDWRVFWDRGPVWSAIELVEWVMLNGIGGAIYVPDLPSGRIADLARCVAPSARVEVTGVRPGEKLHESLISRAEAERATFVGTDSGRALFVIWRDRLMAQERGQSISPGAALSSHQHPRPIDIREQAPC